MRKKYLVKTVNFGRIGHPARSLVDELIRKFGDQEFSKKVRHVRKRNIGH